MARSYTLARIHVGILLLKSNSVLFIQHSSYQPVKYLIIHCSLWRIWLSSFDFQLIWTFNLSRSIHPNTKTPFSSSNIAATSEFPLKWNSCVELFFPFGSNDWTNRSSSLSLSGNYKCSMCRIISKYMHVLSKTS